MTSKRLCEQDKTVVIFSDLPPDLVAMYMAIYKDWLRARLRLREYFRVASCANSTTWPLGNGPVVMSLLL
jgi:hypothetical protein